MCKYHIKIKLTIVLIVLLMAGCELKMPSNTTTEETIIDYSLPAIEFIHEDLLFKDQFSIDPLIIYKDINKPFVDIFSDLYGSTLETNTFIIDGSIYRLDRLGDDMYVKDFDKSEDIIEELKMIADDTILNTDLMVIDPTSKEAIACDYAVDNSYERDKDGYVTVGIRYGDSYLKRILESDHELFIEDIYEVVYPVSDFARYYKFSIASTFDDIKLELYAYNDETILNINDDNDLNVTYRFEYDIHDLIE